MQKHKTQQRQQIERLDIEITTLLEKRQIYAQLMEDTARQLQEEEAAMRQEIQKYEAEIKSVRVESSQTEQALANKEKSSQYQQVNQFFANEVPTEYLTKISECFSKLNKSTDYKLTLFEEKKKLNQLEYECSQSFSQSQEFDIGYKTEYTQGKNGVFTMLGD